MKFLVYKPSSSSSYASAVFRLFETQEEVEDYLTKSSEKVSLYRVFLVEELDMKVSLSRKKEEESGSKLLPR